MERSAGVTGVGAGEGQDRPVLPFGVEAIDAQLPGGGLALGCLHEVSGGGCEIDYAAAGLFVAGVTARLQGMVLWVIGQPDLFAPGLAAAGLHPERLIIAEAGRAAAGGSVLLVMEEGLRHRGLAAVVGEVHGRLGLTASRRLQLAAEAGGVTGFVLRRTSLSRVPLKRTQHPDDPAPAEPIAAATRWRISPLPSAPPIPHAPEVPGLGRARWRVELLRCRSGTPSTWIMEACDAAGRLGMAEPVPDRGAAGSTATGQQHPQPERHPEAARGSRIAG
jgi:protein ImuA